MYVRNIFELSVNLRLLCQHFCSIMCSFICIFVVHRFRLFLSSVIQLGDNSHGHSTSQSVKHQVSSFLEGFARFIHSVALLLLPGALKSLQQTCFRVFDTFCSAESIPFSSPRPQFDQFLQLQFPCLYVHTISAFVHFSSGPFLPLISARLTIRRFAYLSRCVILCIPSFPWQRFLKLGLFEGLVSLFHLRHSSRSLDVKLCIPYYSEYLIKCRHVST